MLECKVVKTTSLKQVLFKTCCQAFLSHWDIYRKQCEPESSQLCWNIRRNYRCLTYCINIGKWHCLCSHWIPLYVCNLHGLFCPYFLPFRILPIFQDTTQIHFHLWHFSLLSQPEFSHLPLSHLFRSEISCLECYTVFISLTIHFLKWIMSSWSTGNTCHTALYPHPLLHSILRSVAVLLWSHGQVWEFDENKLMGKHADAESNFPYHPRRSGVCHLAHVQLMLLTIKEATSPTLMSLGLNSGLYLSTAVFLTVLPRTYYSPFLCLVSVIWE